MKRSGTLAILCILLGAAAYADTVPITLSYIYSGTTTKIGSLTATFTDVAGGVQLTLDTTKLTAGQYVSEWDFNLNPNYSSSLTFTPSADIAVGTDAFKADGDGYYDISFTANFAAGGTYTYLIGGSGLTAYDFYYKSAVNSNHGDKGPYLSAAHLQASHGGGPGAWIAGVPEASQIPVYAVVVAGLFLGAWQRIRPRLR